MTTSAAWLVKCFCKTKKEAEKKEIGRSLAAVNYFQSSGNCTPNTCLKLFQVENAGLDSTIFLFLGLKFFSQIWCGGGGGVGGSRETIIMVQKFV